MEVAEAGAACWLISSVAAGVAEANAACWLAGVDYGGRCSMLVDQFSGGRCGVLVDQFGEGGGKAGIGSNKEHG